ncbi:putative K(+)-stimulated pyrophosphate-energized sodium pump [Capsicum chinense]|nr:putative K(+)-stimulated pyrophosphate-energized sodium pump [Capsicum chinense]
MDMLGPIVDNAGGIVEMSQRVMLMIWRKHMSAWACTAVGRTTQEIVNEVRRQFIERPGIMDYKERPNYSRCVSIIVSASLRVIIKPGALAIISPTVGGDWSQSNN